MGRAGLTGRAFTVATPVDGKYLDAIETLIGKKIPRRDGKSAVPEIAPASAPPPAQSPAPTAASAQPGTRQPGPPQQGASGEPGKRRRCRRGGRRRHCGGHDRPGMQPGGPPHTQQPGRRPQQGPSPHQSLQPQRRDHGHGPERVKGLGDHVPAFLRTRPPVDGGGKKD